MEKIIKTLIVRVVSVLQGMRGRTVLVLCVVVTLSVVSFVCVCTREESIYVFFLFLTSEVTSFQWWQEAFFLFSLSDSSMTKTEREGESCRSGNFDRRLYLFVYVYDEGKALALQNK